MKLKNCMLRTKTTWKFPRQNRFEFLLQMDNLLIGIVGLTLSLALAIGVYFFTRASYEPMIAKLQKQVATLRAITGEQAPDAVVEEDDKTDDDDDDDNKPADESSKKDD